MGHTTEKIKAYLRRKVVLIVEEGDSCRHSIANTLVQLGVKKPNIYMQRTFAGAQEIIQSKKPEIIVCEYAIDGLYGLDLLELQKQYREKSWDHLFVLVTVNGEESTVAEAAEEDVDAYILKPPSPTILKEYLREAILRKVIPPDYILTIQDGRDYLDAGSLDEAYKTFTLAKEMDPKPSLACYYCGLTNEKRQNWAAALQDYQEGLKFNEIHYKCLIGEFESLEKLGRNDEAYLVIQKLLKYFPVSPQRLGKIFTLAVRTRNFEDVDKYYSLFQELGRQTEQLVAIVSAGLMACGKYHLLKGKKVEAGKVFHKAITASGINMELLEKSVLALVEAGAGQGATKLLSLYPQAQREDIKFSELEFMVFTITRNITEVLEKGRKLSEARVKNPKILKIYIETLLKAKNFKLAETMSYKAFELFPDHRSEFRPLLERAESEQS